MFHHVKSPTAVARLVTGIDVAAKAAHRIESIMNLLETELRCGTKISTYVYDFPQEKPIKLLTFSTDTRKNLKRRREANRTSLSAKSNLNIFLDTLPT